METLAIHGGPKAVSRLLPHWPQFDEETIQAVEQVLRSGRVNYWTGPKGMEFEKNFESAAVSSKAHTTSGVC